MPADGSTLVLVMPDEPVESIAARVRQSGAARVQLLVPDGTGALQSGSGFARLRQALGAGQIELQVISSDERTLSAARASQFETVSVEGARVTPPPAPGNGRTVVLPPVQPAPAPLSPEDAEFLAALERLPQNDPYSDLAREDPNLFSGIDDLADLLNDPQPVPGPRSTPTGRGPAPRRRAPQAEPEPDWEEETRERRAPAAGRPPRRDERGPDWDEDAGAEERPRRRSTARQASPDDPLAERRVRRGDLRSTTPSRTRSTRRTATSLALEDEPARPRARPARLLIPLVLALLLFGLLVAWYFWARATVQVQLAPPVPVPFEKEVLPLSADAPRSGEPAIQAVLVKGSVQLTAQGRAGQEPTPVGSARGEITLFNRLPQPIDLPANTEFVALNPQGQEARFLIDQPQQVPPAVTTRTTSGENTTYGQITVAVTARSSGSASNVEANSVTRVIINGQAVEKGGQLDITNTALTGGTEENVFVVTQQAVDQALAGVDEQLAAAAAQQLAPPPERPSFVIDPSTLQRTGMQTTAVSPTLGTQLDPQNPVFSVTVAATYDALATPASLLLSKQLATVVPEYISRRPGPAPFCPDGQTLAGVRVDAWRWAETRLEADGVGSCAPDPAIVRAQVVSAVRGQSRAAAEEHLGGLRQQGVIADFALPDRDTLPSYDFLLDVALAAPPAATPGPDASPPAATPAAPATPPAEVTP